MLILFLLRVSSPLRKNVKAFLQTVAKPQFNRTNVTDLHQNAREFMENIKYTHKVLTITYITYFVYRNMLEVLPKQTRIHFLKAKLVILFTRTVRYRQVLITPKKR